MTFAMQITKPYRNYIGSDKVYRVKLVLWNKILGDKLNDSKRNNKAF